MTSKTATPAHPSIDLPAPLCPLAELAANLWWSWDAHAPALFGRIDADLWKQVEHNPITLLRRMSAARTNALAGDRAFVASVKDTHRRFRAYMRARTWFASQKKKTGPGTIAYFSMEFGLHESLPIYAGGLGILAGDHFKSASDLGLPLVGVGIFWRQGYCRQQISPQGRQTETYDRLRAHDLPLIEVTTPTGRPLRLKVPMGGETVHARAWRLAVGRVNILLLDTHLTANPTKHRKLTDRLYAGDRDLRIRQEILLGVGGWQMLRALKLPVRLCHLNEGHAAFCSLERMAELIKTRGVDIKEAGKSVSAGTVFTTHTPVPAGNESFDPALVDRYMGGYARRLGIRRSQLLDMGRVNPKDKTEDFGMTPLALRLADKANGVAALHGAVSRRMWQSLWPKRSVERVPIGAVTNGVHLRTWLHPRMAELLDQYLPANWDERQDRAAVWESAKRIPDRRLWELHCELKAELVDFARVHLVRELERHGASSAKLRAAGCVLDPGALTLGFARRFAPYKRATLIFADLQRLHRIVSRAGRPVQIIYSGKAHPADADGKRLVAQVVKMTDRPGFRGKIIFLEDYTIDVARHLVAGVDVWLNNPCRPQEASGTSGMKPALHGGLNLSILDGWWPEACQDGKNGWAIGKGVDHDGTAAADRRDEKALYQRLQRDVVPLYYTRNRSGIPTKWVRCMKHAIATIPPAFNSHRMVKEYFSKYYGPLLRKGR